MASTARRIAGNVGLGGPWRILFSPPRLGEAAALQGVGGAALADQPGLLARHVLHALVMDALWRTIGDPHAYGGEGSRQSPFGSLAPADASPLCGGENVFSRRGELIGDVALARPPASGDRKREPDMARIDFLLLGDSDRPLQAARVEPLAERRGQAIACIRQHRRKPDASGADAIDLGERDLRLRA